MQRRWQHRLVTMIVLVVAWSQGEPRARALDEVHHIVVLPVKLTQGIAASQARLLEEIALDELSKRVPKGVKVIGSADVKALLDHEANKQMSACEQDSCLAEIGAAMGATHLVEVTVGRLGSRYAISTKLIGAVDASVVFRKVLYIPAQDDALVLGLQRSFHEMARSTGWQKDSTASAQAAQAAQRADPPSQKEREAAQHVQLLRLSDAGVEIRLPAGFLHQRVRIGAEERPVIWPVDQPALEFTVTVGHSLLPLRELLDVVAGAFADQIKLRGGHERQRQLERKIGGRPARGIVFEGIQGAKGVDTSLYFFLVKDGYRFVTFVFSATGEDKKPLFAACDKIFAGVRFVGTLPPPPANLGQAFASSQHGDREVKPVETRRATLDGAGVTLRLPKGAQVRRWRDDLGQPAMTMSSTLFPGFVLTAHASVRRGDAKTRAHNFRTHFAALLDTLGGYSDARSFTRKVGHREAAGFGFEGTRHHQSGLLQVQHAFVVDNRDWQVLLVASAPSQAKERMMKTFAKILDQVRFAAPARGGKIFSGTYCYSHAAGYERWKFDRKGQVSLYSETSGFASLARTLSLDGDEVQARGSYRVEDSTLAVRLSHRRFECEWPVRRRELRCGQAVLSPSLCE